MNQKRVVSILWFVVGIIAGVVGIIMTSTYDQSVFHITTIGGLIMVIIGGYKFMRFKDEV